MTSYCYNCGHLTPGEPLFCNYCGRSYDLKLCPRLHPNPRSAEICSRCGSRELSTPQPKVPAVWKLLAILIRLGLGLLLTYITLAFLIALAKTPAFQQGFVAFAFLILGLWLVWSKLPEWLQDALRQTVKRRRRRDDD
jgi:RNA polymerase subunit RPABC4/transcription elongation factor Spt4